MERNVKKYVEEYNKNYVRNNRTNKGAFYVADMEQIIALAKEKNGNENNYIWWLISYAMEFGFMVGYKLAKREEAKKGVMSYERNNNSKQCSC